MKLVTRLMMGIGGATAAGVLIAVLGTVQMKGIAGDLDVTASSRIPGIRQVTVVKDSVAEASRHATAVALSADPEFRANQKRQSLAARDQAAKALAALQAQLQQQTQRELFGQVQRAQGELNAKVDETLAMGEEGRSPYLIGKFVTDSVVPRQTALFKVLDQLVEFQAKAAEADAAAAGTQANRASILMLALAAGMLVLGGLAALMLMRNLRRALGAEPDEVAGVVTRVAEGDLSQRIELREVDQHSIMARVAHMQGALASTVGTVRANAEEVATAAAQIAQGNQDLSMRTEQQASTVEETSATMTELSQAVRQNSEHAAQANQLARSANDAAAEGGRLVGEVVATMRGIDESSRKVADIISVIDGIAFQTNILALNAAVEAARAGEQGRGFAVVAGEVRNLAQRSASAAREIKALISASVEQTERGSTLVDQAGAAMQSIVDAIRRVDDIVGEISVASREQSDGIAQVEAAVAQMDQTTQQTAALVEQSAAAAESLRQQAHSLVGSVEMFRVPQPA